MANSMVMNSLYIIAGGKCRRFATIGLMESVIGKSMTKALLVEVEACIYLNERTIHTEFTQ